MAFLLLPPSTAQAQCETEADGCLGWGVTFLDKLGNDDTEVTIVSGDGETAILQEIDTSSASTPARAGSYTVADGVQSFDLGGASFDTIRLRDMSPDGSCAVGFYTNAISFPVVGDEQTAFIADFVNGRFELDAELPDNTQPPATATVGGWALIGSTAQGVRPDCFTVTGASQAVPAAVSPPLIWGMSGMVWSGLFPVLLGDFATQGPAPEFFPSFFSDGRAITDDGVFVAGASTADPIINVVPGQGTFAGTWPWLQRSDGAQTVFTAIEDGAATDVTIGGIGSVPEIVGVYFPGGAATFPPRGFRTDDQTGGTFEDHGLLDPVRVWQTSLLDNGTALFPTTDGGTLFTTSILNSRSSDSALGDLGLDHHGLDINPNAISQDELVWGGHDSGGTPTLLNVTPLRLAFLGDSYGSGEGARNIGEAFGAAYGATASATNRCHRSIHAAASISRPRTGNRSFRDLGTDISNPFDFEWEFIACSGAESIHFYDTVQGFNDDNGNFQPYSTPDGVTQASRINPDVNIIVMSIGGNDAQFAPTAMWCLATNCVTFDFFGFASNTPAQATLELINTTVRNLLDTAFSRLRSDFPNAEIYTFGYPLLVQEAECGGSAIGIAAFTLDEAQFIRSAAARLNTVIRQVATANGIHFVPVAHLFEQNGGRNLCGAAPAINGLTLNAALDMPHGKPEMFHPNVQGHLLYQEAIEDYLASTAPFNRDGLPRRP